MLETGVYSLNISIFVKMINVNIIFVLFLSTFYTKFVRYLFACLKMIENEKIVDRQCLIDVIVKVSAKFQSKLLILAYHF